MRPALRAGEVAVYERPTRSIRCVVCPPPRAVRAGPSTPASPAPPLSASTSGEGHPGAGSGEASAVVGRVVLAVTDDPQSTRAWATGARARRSWPALEGIDGLRVLNDRRVPGTRGNIDHIVIAPAGVFVVDAKHYEAGSRSATKAGSYARTTASMSVGGTFHLWRTASPGRSRP